MQVNHPALQSTPQAKGSATISEHIGTVGVQVSEIRPWITKDIRNSVECSVDEMLKDLLMDCTVMPQASFDEAYKTRLFEECLERVLPICNGSADTPIEDMKGKSDQVRENLAAYSRSRAEAEKELYPLFVKAANTALLFLQYLEIADVRPAKGLPAACFHVHDPALLTQRHQGQVSQRKPDVIVVSDADARDAQGAAGDFYTQKDLFLGMAMQAPTKPFKWRSVRTFVEFKKSKNKMELPPKSYFARQYTPPKEHEYLRMDVESESDLDALPAVSALSSENPRPPSQDPVRRSARQQEKAAATNSNSRKRTSEQFDPPEYRSKRLKSMHKKGHPVIVQAGYYAAEMFAAHTARLHVIGLVIVGDILYLWRYDRQGAIQCSGFNFIQDLPRFLVLLLTMQRFQNQHWGLNPDVDPGFGPRPDSHQTNLCGEKGETIDLSLELSDEERVSHFGLNGRATNVLSVKSRNLSDQENDLVIKVFWAEVTRTGEPDILNRAYEIAEGNAEVKGHIPEMLWYKVFKDTSTAKIRERLGLKNEGARVLYMIIFRKLRPITELVGDDFLRVWWATAMCHLALWKNQVYHRDISPSNLMYRRDKEGKIIGVLNDFDLASTQETATGTERTGTVPFMALTLLQDKSLQGESRHTYEHDAESFIWVLIWTCLRYDSGKLRESMRPFDKWLRVGPARCRKEKTDFLYNSDWSSLKAGVGHEKNWRLARKCIFEMKKKALDAEALQPEPWAVQDDAEEPRQDAEQLLDADTVFQILLEGPAHQYLQGL